MIKLQNCLYLFLSLFSVFCNPLYASTPPPLDIQQSDTQFFITAHLVSPQESSRVFLQVQPSTMQGFYIHNHNAQFMLEKNALFTYIGPEWRWQYVDRVSFSQRDNDVTWKVNKNILGNTTHIVAIAETPASFAESDNVLATQKIAVPSYFAPCTGSNCYWTQLNNSIPKVKIAIINPNSGPGTSSNRSYVTQTKTTQSLGGVVIGYVYTSYGSRSLSQVKADIDKYYNWYKVDGIFFDEGYSSDCGKVSYYTNLKKYVKNKGGKALTVVNYGTNTPQCYITASDILVVFESSYSSYVNWRPSSWYFQYSANHFWHIVYAASQSNMLNAVKLAKQRNGGYVYVTNDVLNNPYDTLPPSTYWNAELNALS